MTAVVIPETLLSATVLATGLATNSRGIRRLV
jgi:hypothetical protein